MIYGLFGIGAINLKAIEFQDGPNSSEQNN